MKLPELKELMKQHNIRGSSYLNKPQIISRLVEKGVLTLGVVENWKQPPKVTREEESTSEEEESTSEESSSGEEEESTSEESSSGEEEKD